MWFFFLHRGFITTNHTKTFAKDIRGLRIVNLKLKDASVWNRRILQFEIGGHNSWNWTVKRIFESAYWLVFEKLFPSDWCHLKNWIQKSQQIEYKIRRSRILHLELKDPRGSLTVSSSLLGSWQSSLKAFSIPNQRAYSRLHIWLFFGLTYWFLASLTDHVHVKGVGVGKALFVHRPARVEAIVNSSVDPVDPECSVGEGRVPGVLGQRLSVFAPGNSLEWVTGRWAMDEHFWSGFRRFVRHMFYRRWAYYTKKKPSWEKKNQHRLTWVFVWQ